MYVYMSFERSLKSGLNLALKVHDEKYPGPNRPKKGPKIGLALTLQIPVENKPYNV